MTGEIITKEKHPKIYDWLCKNVIVWNVSLGVWDDYNNEYLTYFSLLNNKINAYGDVKLKDVVTHIKYPFGYVGGNFYCNHCKHLTSFKNCPEVINGNLDCSFCMSLNDFEYFPKVIRENFCCHSCENLKTLKGCLDRIIGHFDCSACKSLISFEGFPQHVIGSFDCRYCTSIKSLKGFPKKINGNIYMMSNISHISYVDMWFELLDSVSDNEKFKYIDNYINKHDNNIKSHYDNNLTIPIIPKEVINKYKIDFLLKDNNER